MLDADIAAGKEVEICTIKGEKSDIQKLGKIPADKIDGVVFASEFAKNYVAKSWRNTVKNLSSSLQKRRRKRKTTNTRKKGAVKYDNLSLQLSFAPQWQKRLSFSLQVACATCFSGTG